MRKYKNGEPISYVVVKKRGSAIQMTARNGFFVEYVTEHLARVKAVNGRKSIIKVSSIRKEGIKNALTEALTNAGE